MTAATETASSSSWEADFTAEQLEAFKAALARWQDYERESEPIWKHGIVTDASTALFRSYFVSPVWQQYVDRLRRYEGADVHVRGMPAVLWSRVKAADVTNGAGSISITQCVDYQTQVVTQGDKKLAAIPQPALRTATLDRSGEHPWLLLRITEPSLDEYKRCSAVAP